MLEQESPDVALLSANPSSRSNSVNFIEGPIREDLIPEDMEPLVFAENREAFKQVGVSFAEAERRIKLIEWLDGTDIPSINELRYVGYHILKACQKDDAVQQREELKRADRHCKRASFDALELGLISSFETVKAFQERHATYPVSDVLSDYHDMMTDVVKAQSFLAQNSGGEYRDEYYDTCEGWVSRLVDIAAKLTATDEEISKKKSIFYQEQGRVAQADELAARAEQRAERAENRADRVESLMKQRLFIMAVIALASLGGLYFKMKPTEEAVPSAVSQVVVDASSNVKTKAEALKSEVAN